MTMGVETAARQPAFTTAGLYAGAAAAVVLIPSIVAFGAAFGVLAGRHGLTSAEAVLMSLLVCAGTAQFAALQSWTEPASVLAAGFASLALNSRYILLGAATRPWFVHMPAGRVYLSLAFLYDANFALTAREQAAGRHDAAHLLGGGLVCCGVWTLATGLGHGLGAVLGDTHRLGLDFVLTAFFAAMMVGLFRGRSDVAIVTAAIGVAVLTDHWFPGPWHMITGALAGSAVAAITSGTAER